MKDGRSFQYLLAMVNRNVLTSCPQLLWPALDTVDPAGERLFASTQELQFQISKNLPAARAVLSVNSIPEIYVPGRAGTTKL